METTIVADSDTILLFHPNNAHTNGDTWVLFKNDNVVALGDLLFTNSMPYIDDQMGANTLNWILTLNKLADKNYNTYISGHSRLAKPVDLRRFASYLADLRKAVQAEIKSGKTVEEIKKTIDLPEYRDFGFQFFKEQNIEAVYKELSR